MLRMLLVMGLALCGCGKSHLNRGSVEEILEIPGKIELHEERFPAITEAQYLSGQNLLSRLQMVNRLRPHILVSPDEPDKSKERRDAEFLKLSSEQKLAVAQINTHCQVTNEPSDAKALGTELNLIEELRTIGQSCPARLSDRSHLVWTVLSSDERGESGVVRLWDHRILESQYDRADLAQAAGATRVHIETLARGRVEISPESSRTYARLRGQGRIDSTAWGPITVNLDGEYLDDDVRTVALYLTVVIEGAVHNMALQAAQDEAGVISISRFFIGDRELSEKERDAIDASHLANLILK